MTVICPKCKKPTTGEGEIQTLHEDYCEILLECGHVLVYHFHCVDE